MLCFKAVMMSTTSGSTSSIATISLPAILACTISRTASFHLFSSVILSKVVDIESIKLLASLSSSLLAFCFSTNGTSSILRISFG